MFAHRFFGDHYYGARYFGDGGSGSSPVTPLAYGRYKRRRRGGAAL